MYRQLSTSVAWAVAIWAVGGLLSVTYELPREIWLLPALGAALASWTVVSRLASRSPRRRVQHAGHHVREAAPATFA